MILRKNTKGELYTIDINRTVQVYRNLTHACWSVKQDGRVVAHADEISLSNVYTIVNQKGRKRVIQEKQKNVHAFLVGKIMLENIALVKELYYNPYMFSSFVDKVELYPVETAMYVHCGIDKKVRYV